MIHPSIFASILGLTTPWQITSVEIGEAHPRLDIFITCSLTMSIPCPVCGDIATVCDLSTESWRHDHLFNKDVHVHARIPLVTCASDCGCFRLNAPWAHNGSRFLLQDRHLPHKCASCRKAGTIAPLTLCR